MPPRAAGPAPSCLLPFGIDGPFELGALAVGASLAVLAAATAPALAAPRAVTAGAALAAGGLTGCLATYLHTTLRGKAAVWQELAGGLELRGDERILDAGCGSGTVLLGTARHLTTGHAVGIDRWQRRDQWRSSLRAVRANIAAAGLADRVRLATADMTALPFADASFDLVAGCMALHNLHPAGRRRTALAEAVRVLRPGGLLLLVDIRSRRYPAALTALGMRDVVRRSLGPRMWWCGPLVTTALTSARKPGPGTGRPRASHPKGPVDSVD
ncbi:class I SAM-dependent methyltransferase [Streptomyces sp. NPDC049555]|uniref:class I SAM-dependent methyltransferase n=1 Tax=Streptomyces sp. NPDC049555 TaxID=3154930 RepID=UPI003441622C